MSIEATILKEYFMGLDASPAVKDFFDRLVESVKNVDTDGAAQTEVTANKAEYDAHTHGPGDPQLVDHNELDNVTEDQHHDKMHDLDPTPGEGLDPHHNNTPASLPEGYLAFDEVDGHDHDGVSSHTVDHGNLASVETDQHHAQVHDIGGAAHNADTYSNLQTKVSDKTLAKLEDAQTFSGQKTFTSGIKVSEIDEAVADAGYLLKNAQGIGGADGKSKVFTSHYATFQAAMVDGAGKTVVVDSDINCTAAVAGSTYDNTVVIGAGGKITTVGNIKLFDDIDYLKLICVDMYGSNNAAYTSNHCIDATCNYLVMISCLVQEFYYGINSNYANLYMKIIGNTFKGMQSYAIYGSGNRSNILSNVFIQCAHGINAWGYYANIKANVFNNMGSKTGVAINLGNTYEGSPCIVEGNSIYYCGVGIAAGNRTNASVINNAFSDCTICINCNASTSYIASISIENNRVTAGTITDFMKFVTNADGFDNIHIEGNKIYDTATVTNGINFAIGEAGLRTVLGNDMGHATNPIIFHSKAQEGAVAALGAYAHNIGAVTYTT